MAEQRHSSNGADLRERRYQAERHVLLFCLSKVLPPLINLERCIWRIFESRVTRGQEYTNGILMTARLSLIAACCIWNSACKAEA